MHESALRSFLSLISSDIADLDKALIYDMAVGLEQWGRDQEALASYDQGMS